MKKTRQAIIWNSVSEREQLSIKAVPGTDIGLSGASIPIISSDRVLGIINVENHRREYAFGELELRLLTTIAASLGTALENARLFTETERLFKAGQERVTELQIINSIQQGLAAELDFQSIVDLVGDKLREVLGTGNLGIRWYDEKNNLIHYLYVYENGERLTVNPQPPRAGGIFDRITKTRQPIVLHNVTETTSIAHTIPGTDTSKSSAFIPIISSDRVLGGISIENYERENAFGEADLRMLTTIAASLGTALENARLFAETQRLLEETEQRAAELALINNIAEIMTRQLDLETVSRIVGDQIREIFKADTANISLYDAGSNTINHLYYYDNGYVKVKPFTMGRGLTSKIITTRQPLLLGSREEFEENGAVLVDSADGSEDQNQSYLGVPIFAGEIVFGVVALQSYQAQAFNQTHLGLLTTMANNMGGALENARLLSELAAA